MPSRDALYACAALLESRADLVVATAAEETGLTETRLRGELTRTTGQLRLLADIKPWRREAGGIVTLPVPVGRVAVFAASNFPLAFGVLGGDTASATAAGCPVTVKAHPAHPRLSQVLATIAAQALCTKPGLVITSSPSFARDLATAVAASPTHRMLTPGMAAAHANWRAQAESLGEIVAGTQDPAPFAPHHRPAARVAPGRTLRPIRRHLHRIS